MSTRCNIIIKYDSDKEIKLYHHHDGYPECVGADLISRIETAGKYLDGEHLINSMIKDTEDEYEFTSYLAGDAEYIYIVNVDKKEIKYKKRSITSNRWSKEKKLY